MRCAIAIAFVVVLIGRGLAAGDIQLTGESEVLRNLVAGLRAKLVEFPIGELRGRYFEEHPPCDEVRVDVRFVWSGDRKYWEYSRRVEDRCPGERAPVDPLTGMYVDQNDGVKVVQLEGRTAMYRPDLGASGFLIEHMKKTRLSEFLWQHPQDRWYRKEHGKFTWADYLDPVKMEGAGYLVGLDTQLEGDLVHVTRRAKDGSAVNLVFSLAHGGNLLSYETVRGPGDAVSSDGRLHRGRYEWDPLGDGRWYPKLISFEQAMPESPDEPYWRITINVETFDPNPRIPGDLFELQVPDGTHVYHRSKDGRKKRYYVGQPSAKGDVSEQRLNHLSEKLRSQEFASP